MPARATSAASCSGPLGRRCDVPATSVIASSASPISASSNRIGSIDQIRSQATSIVLFRGEALGRLLRLREHRRELAGVEVALVEELLGGLDDRGDDPRPADDAAARADRAVAGLGCDPADVERELRGAGERVAPLVHRRRAGVRGLARPGDPVALDAEGAEHDAEREVHRLEHRPLLDVQLEVGGRVLELPPAPRSRGRGRRRARRARPGAAIPSRSVSCRSSSWSRIEPAAALEPKSERPNRAPSSSAQLTSRTVSGGLAVLGDPPQHLDTGHARSGSRRASRRSAPSRCGRRSGAPARTRRGA